MKSKERTLSAETGENRQLPPLDSQKTKALPPPKKDIIKNSGGSIYSKPIHRPRKYDLL